MVYTDFGFHLTVIDMLRQLVDAGPQCLQPCLHSDLVWHDCPYLLKHPLLLLYYQKEKPQLLIVHTVAGLNDHI